MANYNDRNCIHMLLVLQNGCQTSMHFNAVLSENQTRNQQNLDMERQKSSYLNDKISWV